MCSFYADEIVDILYQISMGIKKKTIKGSLPRSALVNLIFNKITFSFG